jgi:Fic family protein
MADNSKMDSRNPYLSRLKISYEIIHTDALVKLLMRIAQSKPFIDEYLGTPQVVKLLRKTKVRALAYSNQIEGNGLGESEVTAVLQGKGIAETPKDPKEVTNYH